ncbi:MAG TPA: hypothetical protein VK081_03555, partial [Planctomycetota bacterium]|nr:hypothetical protein [Planctomycetota bacterium]
RVHEGVIQLAAEGGRPLYPLGFAFSRGRRLRSWDRFAIPAPFARIVVYLGEPMHVPPDVSRSDRAALARELEARLADAERAAAASLTERGPDARWPARPPRRSSIVPVAGADKRAS